MFLMKEYVLAYSGKLAISVINNDKQSILYDLFKYHSLNRRNFDLCNLLNVNI